MHCAPRGRRRLCRLLTKASEHPPDAVASTLRSNSSQAVSSRLQLHLSGNNSRSLTQIAKVDVSLPTTLVNFQLTIYGTHSSRDRCFSIVLVSGVATRVGVVAHLTVSQVLL